MLGMLNSPLNGPSGRVNLFLLVRTHAQLQYFLGFSDSRAAANQGGISTGMAAATGNVTEIHPLHVPTLRHRG
jgi:hypothetical protein